MRIVFERKKHNKKVFPSLDDSEKKRELFKKVILIAKKEMEEEGATMKHTDQLDDSEKKGINRTIPESDGKRSIILDRQDSDGRSV
ncbi:MAG: hypothetical protein WAM14_24745 [Candidatus Nitrosopolaris sp.]